MTQQVLYNTTTGAVLQWQDTSKFNYAEPPSTCSVLPVTSTEWDNQAGQWWVVNGALTQTNPNAPTAAELLAQAQAEQKGVVTQAYNTATDYVPVTIDGTTYQVDNTTAKQALNLSLAITANAAVQSSAWAADTEYTAGQLCSVSGVILFCSTSGKSGSTAPTPPTTFGTPVTDGTVEWELMERKVYLQDGSFVMMTPQQILSAFQQGELYLHQMSDKLVSLMEQIDAATTVSEVQAIGW
ncbi:hypothetical protein [Candidatus Igneacidithiobacillus taiwanensis]|uniref:hypothetical protein n=1 Tax=Candidatus Igneacidithiobacillus taiwanensis TaxID=1945924 RepID=UPI002897BB94|nr:hypothetical protein [Candidatus Igneacidithiobacillus taiwanensis]